MNKDDKTITLDDLKNPPIIERSVDILYDIDPSDFDSKAPKWLENVSEKGGYQKKRFIKHCHLSINPREDPPRPKAFLIQIPRIEKLNKEGKLIKAIELKPPHSLPPAQERQLARLRFQQGSPEKPPSRYKEVKEEIEKWATDYMNVVQPLKVAGIWVRYRNAISPSKYPAFYEKNSFKLNVLNFFKNNLAPIGNCIPPFKAETNQNLQYDNKSCISRFAVETSQKGEIHVLFDYSGIKREGNEGVDSLLKELDYAHSLILEQFLRHFTPEAIKVFLDAE